MWYPTTNDAGRWLRCCGLAVLLSLAWACDSDTPTTPSPSPNPTSPPTPTPRPTTPDPSGSLKLALSRTDVVFNNVPGGTALDTATVLVSAPSQAALTELRTVTRYAEGQPAGWLAVDVDDTALPTKLTLHATTGTLQPGEYAAVIRVSAPGAAAESLTVTSHVVTGANIGIDAAKICFTTTFGDATPRRDGVHVTSVDGSVIDGFTATIVYDQGQPTGWLEASLDVTTAPAALSLRGTPGSLPPGTYAATVSITSAKAGNSPVPVRVTLTVNPAVQSLLFVHVEWEGPENGGLVTIWGDHGIHCQSGTGGVPPGQGCTGFLDSGVGDLPLTAEADYGARFLRWTGACTGQDPSCTVHFSTPGTRQDVTAIVGTKPTTISNIWLQGAGASGTVTFSAPVTVPGSGGPLTCRIVNGVRDGPCDGVIEAGVGTFTVTATPDPGSVFVNWQIGGHMGDRTLLHPCSLTTPTCTFEVTRGGTSIDGLVTFALASAPSVEIQVEGPGNVTWGYPLVGQCPLNCKQYPDPGTTVRLTGYPETTFIGWTGCPAPSGSTCDIVVGESIVVIARFRE